MTGPNGRKMLIVALAVLALPVLLGACREGEQGRELGFEAGVYKGKTEAPLSADALDRLRERALQQGAGFTSVGGGGVSPSADVRLPGTPPGRSFKDRMSGQTN